MSEALIEARATVPAARPSPGGGRRWRVLGMVQGVGFRPFVHRLAAEERIRGSVRNDGVGLCVEAFAPGPALARFRARLEREAPPGAWIHEVREEAVAGGGPDGFTIEASDTTGALRVPGLPPDLSACEACLLEVRDPTGRRHRYPFTSCAACGPRYTIARDVPYDRARTSMAPFGMCRACRLEYEDPSDRRFHAQPIACPDCGPALAWLDGEGRLAEGEPLDAAARALRGGSVVALRGLGGFHLACDATSRKAVARLRLRKRREARPFAVMVEDLCAARRLARVEPEAARLLASPERPIVIVPARPGAAAGATPLAPEVAPDLPWVGLMLPYTPLHQLLCAAVDRPLVMTSGNRSGETIVTGNDEALRRLHGIADAFLVHDREIVAPCEDSVARVVAGAPLVMRRARGFVPRPVAVARPFPEPVLACGAHLKNAVCIGADGLAWLGPHVGDLDTPEAEAAFLESVERLERFVGVRPEVVAHDLHPGYRATRHALERGARETVAVQHHHAHVASALAEHRIEGPAWGLAWDGTGLGPDGAAWGGELLRVDGASCQRWATLRPLGLVGGERAVRETWRQALALVEDAFEGEPPWDHLALFRRVAPDRLAAVRRLARRGAHRVASHGVGRYFDAVAALVLARPEARFEGELAQLWNARADGDPGRGYPFAWSAGETPPWEVDLRPMVRAVVADLVRGEDPGRISSRFHETLARVGRAMIERASREAGAAPVVLTGGCFQNARLAESVSAGLRGHHEVIRHGAVPPGDGGIALGQAVVAAARIADARTEEDAPCA